MSNKPVVIKFFAPVMDASVNALMHAMDQKMQAGCQKFTILISCPGGSLFYALSAYNYLKGIPAKITTHNFGSLDPLGMVLYCAGEKRLATPQSIFNFTSLTAAFKQNETVSAKQLAKRLSDMEDEVINIARIIGFNISKTVPEITNYIEEEKNFIAEEALKIGLANEVCAALFEADSEVISIHAQTQGYQPTKFSGPN